MVERWGKAVLQRFKKLKAEKNLDGDAESHQWMRGHLGTKVLWKAGGDPLVAWACKVCRLRGQWGTREEECRSVLDKAEDQNPAEASRVFPDAMASPGLKGEREDGLAQDLGRGDGEPLTAGQRMVVEDVRQETALDVGDGEGNVLREEKSQGRGSPARMAASSESAEQRRNKGPMSATLRGKRQSWWREEHGWTCRELDQMMSFSRDRGLRGQEWNVKMRPPPTLENVRQVY